jgi:hypothetical protein
VVVVANYYRNPLQYRDRTSGTLQSSQYFDLILNTFNYSISHNGPFKR